LLRAARHIVIDLGRSDVHFGLVGGGTSLKEMKALAVELGIADCVTFTGRVPDGEMLAMLNTADVCVNPDVANDMNDKSTMNKIMEYMALGKPIVQFDLTEGRYSAQGASLYARRNDHWISRRRSSSCWTTRCGARRWASTGADAWKRARLEPRSAKTARRL